MQPIVAVATAIGLFGGVVGAYVLGARLTAKVGSFSPVPGLVRRCAIVGAFLAALPSFFGALVIGGTMGGSWADAAVGVAVVPVGLAIGIAVFLAGGLFIGVLAGSLLGALLSLPRSQ